MTTEEKLLKVGQTGIVKEVLKQLLQDYIDGKGIPVHSGTLAERELYTPRYRGDSWIVTDEGKKYPATEYWDGEQWKKGASGGGVSTGTYEEMIASESEDGALWVVPQAQTEKKRNKYPGIELGFNFEAAWSEATSFNRLTTSEETAIINSLSIISELSAFLTSGKNIGSFTETKEGTTNTYDIYLALFNYDSEVNRVIQFKKGTSKCYMAGAVYKRVEGETPTFATKFYYFKEGWNHFETETAEGQYIPEALRLKYSEMSNITSTGETASLLLTKHSTKMIYKKPLVDQETIKYIIFPFNLLDIARPLYKEIADKDKDLTTEELDYVREKLGNVNEIIEFVAHLIADLFNTTEEQIKKILNLFLLGSLQKTMAHCIEKNDFRVYVIGYNLQHVLYTSICIPVLTLCADGYMCNYNFTSISVDDIKETLSNFLPQLGEVIGVVMGSTSSTDFTGAASVIVDLLKTLIPALGRIANDLSCYEVPNVAETPFTNMIVTILVSIVPELGPIIKIVQDNLSSLCSYVTKFKFANDSFIGNEYQDFIPEKTYQKIAGKWEQINNYVVGTEKQRKELAGYDGLKFYQKQLSKVCADYDYDSLYNYIKDHDSDAYSKSYKLGEYATLKFKYITQIGTTQLDPVLLLKLIDLIPIALDLAQNLLGMSDEEWAEIMEMIQPIIDKVIELLNKYKDAFDMCLAVVNIESPFIEEFGLTLDFNPIMIIPAVKKDKEILYYASLTTTNNKIHYTLDTSDIVLNPTILLENMDLNLFKVWYRDRTHNGRYLMVGETRIDNGEETEEALYFDPKTTLFKIYNADGALHETYKDSQFTNHLYVLTLAGIVLQLALYSTYFFSDHSLYRIALGEAQSLDLNSLLLNEGITDYLGVLSMVRFKRENYFDTKCKLGVLPIVGALLGLIVSKEGLVIRGIDMKDFPITFDKLIQINIDYDLTQHMINPEVVQDEECNEDKYIYSHRQWRKDKPKEWTGSEMVYKILTGVLGVDKDTTYYLTGE